MTEKARLHRSELAVPGTNVRAMEKAPTLGADLVFLDLEDAVAPDDKEQARANVIEALGAQRLVHDGDQRAHQRPRHPLVLPRRRRRRRGTRRRARHRPGARRWGRPSDVEFVATLLDQIEQRNGWEPGRIGIHILIETAKGMANVEAIARARPDRLEAMVFGVADYAASVQARTTNIGGANPDYAVLTDADADRRARDPLGRPVALRHLADGRRLPRRRVCARSTGRSATSTTRTATGARRDAPPRSVARASGRSTRRRSRWRTRSSRRPTPRSSAHAGSSRRWRTAAKEGKGAVSLDGRLIDAASIRMAREPDHARSSRCAPADGIARARTMNIHEYQAKELLKQLRRARAAPARSSTRDRAAARVAEELGGSRWVVKAQIHAGRPRQGRRREGRQLAREGRRDRRPDARLHPGHGADRARGQAGPPRAGRARVSRIDREFYLSLIVDRDLAEDRRDRLARRAASRSRRSPPTRPEAIHTEYVDPGVGLLDFQCRKVATAIGLAQPRRVVHAAAQAHLPAVPRQGLPAARDQPVHRDRGRRPGRARLQDAASTTTRCSGRAAVVELRDFDEEDPKEVEASGHGLNYIALDGNVGLHRERRRAGDGDDGRDRAPRRAPRELPRRRRRRQPGEDRERLPDRAARTRTSRRSSSTSSPASTDATGSRRASCRRRATRRSTCP